MDGPSHRAGSPNQSSGPASSLINFERSLRTASAPSNSHGSEELSGQALVLGGGMAGMLAARVLVDTFEQVMIIERHLNH
jgi:heterodisulfide reductase subunit A-like polyferredoxin